ncbi:condensation domain-containing protein [Rhizobium leguminosarum]|uniref:condensation domain-containing protein n=1 Tax=Rhizobium leguminosarum TaxID=384 RepID=UPI00202A3FFF|nr:condensation domain-containing protein [Rhizobium leguminosarum]
MPFGLSEVYGDGSGSREARRMLPQALNDRLRQQARRLGVSLASLCHLAWGQVVALSSGREQVVFGTVLFGRMHAGAGADRALGLFINTLPVRLDLDGTGSRRACGPRMAFRAAGARACLAGAGATLQRGGGAGAAVQRAVELPSQHAGHGRRGNKRRAVRPGMAGQRGAHQLSTDPVGGGFWRGARPDGAGGGADLRRSDLRLHAAGARATGRGAGACPQ